MRYLLDTHLLIWAAAGSPKLPQAAAGIIGDDRHEMLFSAASIWEVAIKAGQRDGSFGIDPRVLHNELFDAGYQELPIRVSHTASVVDLPPIHRDPFDRLLIAQARTEGVTLLTHDRTVSEYTGPIELV